MTSISFLEVCERCLVIKEGRIVADGPVSEHLDESIAP